jgi:hypothetical protein
MAGNDAPLASLKCGICTPRGVGAHRTPTKCVNASSFFLSHLFKKGWLVGAVNLFLAHGSHTDEAVIEHDFK